MRNLAGIVAIGLGLFVGCDSRAKASDPVKPDRLGKELESCGSTADCETELHCFDQTCRRMSRSAVGDYYAALGASARAKGDLEGAVAAYNNALGQYDAEKIKLPPEIDCAYGSTLAVARGKKEFAERGAKVLHRCVLAVPVASALRTQAMMDLALLDESGLDPLALGKNGLADVYLTKGPGKPSTDKVNYTAVATPALSAKVAAGLAGKLDEQKAQLVACWQTYTDTSKKDTLAVTVTAKGLYVESDYEGEGGFAVKVEPSPGLAGPEAGADACVRPIVEAALKAAPHEGYSSKLVVTIK